MASHPPEDPPHVSVNVAPEKDAEGPLETIDMYSSQPFFHFVNQVPRFGYRLILFLSVFFQMREARPIHLTPPSFHFLDSSPLGTLRSNHQKRQGTLFSRDCLKLYFLRHLPQSAVLMEPNQVSDP